MSREGPGSGDSAWHNLARDNLDWDNLDWERATASAFQSLIGYRLVLWERDRAVIEYDMDPAHLNRSGLLHGGVIATLLDTASGYAGCWCPVPGRIRRTLTLSLTTNFLAPVQHGRVRVEGRRTGGGRTVFFTTAEAHDDEGRVVATAAGTFRYLPGSGDEQGALR